MKHIFVIATVMLFITPALSSARDTAIHPLYISCTTENGQQRNALTDHHMDCFLERLFVYAKAAQAEQKKQNSLLDRIYRKSNLDSVKRIAKLELNELTGNHYRNMVTIRKDYSRLKQLKSLKSIFAKRNIDINIVEGVISELDQMIMAPPPGQL